MHYTGACWPDAPRNENGPGSSLNRGHEGFAFMGVRRRSPCIASSRHLHRPTFGDAGDVSPGPPMPKFTVNCAGLPREVERTAVAALAGQRRGPVRVHAPAPAP